MTTIDTVVLTGDPRVTTIPVSDNGENLTDLRGLGLRVSPFRADDAGDFAHVRAGLATRLLQAAEVLPRGVHLLITEGYRPPALQRRYFDEYLRLLRASIPDSDEDQLRMLHAMREMRALGMRTVTVNHDAENLLAGLDRHRWTCGDTSSPDTGPRRWARWLAVCGRPSGSAVLWIMWT